MHLMSDDPMKALLDRYDSFAEFVEKHVPFNAFLGVRVTGLRAGKARFEVPWRAEFIGDPVRPAMHGGVISAVADACGGFAVWSELEPVRHRVSTIDLRVDYLRPGQPETLVAEATVLRVGGHVGVADVRLFHPSGPEQTIATAKGVYAIHTVSG